MLRLESVVVRRDRVVLVVRMDEGVPRFTSRELTDRILAQFPDLPFHPCVNAKGPQFGDVMDHTSIPHVLEHLVIDLQADAFTRAHARQEEAGQVRIPPLLTGVTKWIDREGGLAQIQVSFFDDLVALSAIRAGVDFLNTLYVGHVQLLDCPNAVLRFSSVLILRQTGFF